jgi:hypothetical protein
MNLYANQRMMGPTMGPMMGPTMGPMMGPTMGPMMGQRGPMMDQGMNDFVHYHRQGEDIRAMEHSNIPQGAHIREVIETTGMRGDNYRQGMFSKRHMKLYETELASAQEHLQRAAEAAKVGDWRTHDALVETAMERQRSAESHWNKCHV